MAFLPWIIVDCSRDVGPTSWPTFAKWLIGSKCAECETFGNVNNHDINRSSRFYPWDEREAFVRRLFIDGFMVWQILVGLAAVTNASVFAGKIGSPAKEGPGKEEVK